MEHDHRAKAQIFKDTFFPPPPEADLANTNNYTYQNPFAFPPITSREVERAIRNMPPKKAPGRDGIPAHIVQQILPQLNHHLVLLYNACLDLQYYPKHFKQSTTMVLPCKDCRTLYAPYVDFMALNAATV